LLGTKLGVGVGLVVGITLDASVWGDTLGIVVAQVSQVTGHTFFPSPSHTFFCQYGYAVASIFLSFSQLKPWM